MFTGQMWIRVRIICNNLNLSLTCLPFEAQFLTLLSQHGDDFKRIAASMPNKVLNIFNSFTQVISDSSSIQTTIQVNTYFRTNLVDLRLDKVVASAPKRSPTPDGTTPVSNAKFYNSVIEDDDATRIDQTTSPINRPPSVGLPTVVASPTDQNKFSAPPSHLGKSSINSRWPPSDLPTSSAQ